MTSRFAVLAAGGFLLGMAIAPAQAADLGGGCCADLEERVAELEATTARKGNRVVTLQIYGDVTKGLMFWDNGRQSNAYVVDNDALSTLLGFKGEAAMRPGWKAGYVLELQVQDASSSAVTEVGTGRPGDDPADNISIRQSNVYIESETLGRFTIGQGSTAADSSAEITLGNTLIHSEPNHGTSIRLGGSTLTLGELASNFDGTRNDVIRYDSPTILGFILSASWGDNDYWDAALRYSREWNSVKFAAAIAYQNIDAGSDAVLGDPAEIVTGSASIMHVPTGLFVSVQAGRKEMEASGSDASFWYLQGGVERKWFAVGNTTLYGEYGSYDDVLTLTGAATSSEATRWGIGAVQHIDSASMDLYIHAKFWDFEAPGVTIEDLTTVMVGSRIQF
jgi:predicted porin